MGQGEAGEAQEDGEDSDLDWDPEEPLFDEGYEPSPPLSEEDWDKMEKEAGKLMEEEPVEDREAGGGPESGGDAPRRAAKRGRRRRRARPDKLHREAARPETMTRAQMDEHRREGHVNFHPGCRHCVAARA